jgi:hypothetical protein
MRYRTVISVLVAAVLAFTSMSSLAAQGMGGGGSSSGDRTQQMDRDRTFDHDRMADRDRIQDQDRDQDRDRDHLNIQDPAKMKDQDIYGNEFMTNAERNQYRNELAKATSAEERNRYQAQHEKKMQERALQQGKDLVPPGQGPIYGSEYMTVQERNQYREQLRVLGSEQEREKFQAMHRDRINERANALGREVEEAE